MVTSMSRVSSSSDRLKRCSSVSSGASSSVSGVRNSWLMLAKNRLLIWSSSISFWLLSSSAFWFLSSSNRRANSRKRGFAVEVAAGDHDDAGQHEEVEVVDEQPAIFRARLGPG